MLLSMNAISAPTEYFVNLADSGVRVRRFHTR
jgi:hypothetical protein